MTTFPYYVLLHGLQQWDWMAYIMDVFSTFCSFCHWIYPTNFMTFSCGHVTSLLSNTEGLNMIVMGRHKAISKVISIRAIFVLCSLQYLCKIFTVQETNVRDKKGKKC